MRGLRRSAWTEHGDPGPQAYRYTDLNHSAFPFPRGAWLLSLGLQAPRASRVVEHGDVSAEMHFLFREHVLMRF